LEQRINSFLQFFIKKKFHWRLVVFWSGIKDCLFGFCKILFCFLEPTIGCVSTRGSLLATVKN
jgi:hypothetical protein